MDYSAYPWNSHALMDATETEGFSYYCPHTRTNRTISSRKYDFVGARKPCTAPRTSRGKVHPTLAGALGLRVRFSSRKCHSETMRVSSMMWREGLSNSDAIPEYILRPPFQNQLIPLGVPSIETLWHAPCGAVRDADILQSVSLIRRHCRSSRSTKQHTPTCITVI